MVDRRTTIDFGERGQRLPTTLLIEGEVTLERLLDDPPPGALEALGETVQLAGELISWVRHEVSVTSQHQRGTADHNLERRRKCADAASRLSAPRAA